MKYHSIGKIFSVGLAALIAFQLYLHLASSPPILEEIKKEKVEEKEEVPKELTQLIYQGHKLQPEFLLLGRSPVVDAVLYDPFYLPSYARSTAEALKSASEKDSLSVLFSTVLKAGAIPASIDKEDFLQKHEEPIPDSFLSAFGEKAGKELALVWHAFINIHKEIEEILKVFSDEEREWIVNNREAFFFGNSPRDRKYDFLTTESEMPLKFFELSARLDLARMAECADQLCLIGDYVHEKEEVFAEINLKEDFILEDRGLSFFVTSRQGLHDRSADFFLNFSHKSTFTNNAGGTEGKRAAALFIDMGGDNTYLGKDCVQGSGVMGVGVFASFKGKNTYQAHSYAQGAAFFGSGVLMDRGGGSNFTVQFFGQSAAAFGSALLWIKEGGNHFTASEGMAQAASSTLGVAFLVDNEGNDTFSLGKPGMPLTRDSGIGQGASIGSRAKSWHAEANFYGGVSFLYVGGGSNKYSNGWFGQGSAYFFGVGVLVDAGGKGSKFDASVDSQGQGLHYGAGILLKEGGNDRYDGGWGSLGVGGDHSVGILIDTGGSDTYAGTVQSVGSARKPKGLGVFIDVKGNDSYGFTEISNAHVQKPSNPEEWPTALFLDLQGYDTYPERVDSLTRCNNCSWGDEKHGTGRDLELDSSNMAQKILDAFPDAPRAAFPFDPQKGWKGNTAYRPLLQIHDESQAQSLILKIPEKDYDGRRQAYESLYLWRLQHPDKKFSTKKLLQNGHANEDQLAWALIWALMDEDSTAIESVKEALDQESISSAFARRIAIKYLGVLGGPHTALVLAKLASSDPSLGNRSLAVLYLATIPSEEAFNLVKPFLKTNSERLKYAALAGLRNSREAGVLEAVIPLLNDSSFYVRRAAAMTAISLHYKPAIPVLLDTFFIETVDTDENYGDNLYNELASYVGVNLGVSPEKWRKWWESVEDSFEFPQPKPQKK